MSEYQLPMEGVVATPGSDAPAGTRSGAFDLQRCRALLAEVVTDEEWKMAFRAAIELVKYGKDMRARVAALALLMRYQFGLPAQGVEVAVEPEPIRLIEVHLNERRRVLGWGDRESDEPPQSLDGAPGGETSKARTKKRGK